MSFLAFRRLKIYTHLRPTEYNVFSERTINSERPFRGPLKPSNQHPNPAFSDNSPYLGDSGIVFLCAVGPGYPDGSANPSIRSSMLANSRRVRWLSAKSSQ